MAGQHVKTEQIDEQTLVELDAYSSDGQYIGTVAGYLPLEQDNEQAFESGVYDIVGEDSRLENRRRVMINGIGTTIQTRVTLPVDQLKVDLKGRRVTVPLTVADIVSLSANKQGD